MIYTLRYSKGEVELKHFSLKCLEVSQRTFFVFISLLRTLKRGLKSTAEPMYSSLHLSQVIKYIRAGKIRRTLVSCAYRVPEVASRKNLNKFHKCLLKAYNLHIF